MGIADVRKKKNQSVAEAAAELGVTEVCWRYWEKREKTPNDANKLKLIEWSGGSLTLLDFFELPVASRAATGDNLAAFHGGKSSPDEDVTGQSLDTALSGQMPALYAGASS